MRGKAHWLVFFFNIPPHSNIKELSIRSYDWTVDEMEGSYRGYNANEVKVNSRECFTAQCKPREVGVGGTG